MSKYVIEIQAEFQFYPMHNDEDEFITLIISCCMIMQITDHPPILQGKLTINHTTSLKNEGLTTLDDSSLDLSTSSIQPLATNLIPATLFYKDEKNT